MGFGWFLNHFTNCYGFSQTVLCMGVTELLGVGNSRYQVPNSSWQREGRSNGGTHLAIRGQFMSLTLRVDWDAAFGFLTILEIGISLMAFGLRGDIAFGWISSLRLRALLISTLLALREDFSAAPINSIIRPGWELIGSGQNDNFVGGYSAVVSVKSV